MRARTFLRLIWILISVASGWGATPSLSLARQPLSFEPNLGQTSPEAKYLARGNGYELFLTQHEAVLRLRQKNFSDSILRVRWIFANPAAAMHQEEELEGRVNYLRGNDPTNWLTNVHTFRKVRLAKVYKGIDLVFYGNQRELEYDFVLAPGADYKQIVLAFDGAQQISLDRNGDLILTVNGGELRQHKPVVYQVVAGKKKKIEGRFLLAKDNTVSFSLGEYDHSKALVIDPTLSYSTYLGGSGSEQGNSVAVDSSGRAYITGTTDSTDFPVKGGVQSSSKGGRDVFVTKLWATGGGLIYSTYVGGSAEDRGTGIAVDRFGNAYVAGSTFSTNFPTTSDAFQQSNMGLLDGFVLKLSPNGNALVYSTYLGGNGYDDLQGLALDSKGRAYITGTSDSANYPLVMPADPTSSSDEVVVTRLNPNGSALEYSTYLGGSGREIGGGIAVDSSFRAYVTGATESSDFPVTAGAFQHSFQGGVATRPDPVLDAFATRLSPDGSSLSYSTYLGGKGQDEGFGIAVDDQNRAYVTGSTTSSNFPTTAGAFRRSLNGPGDSLLSHPDAFVTKLWATGGGLIYSTYLGGSDSDIGRSIAVDSAHRAWLTGDTASSNFPTKNSFHSYRGNQDVFVTKMWATGGGLIFSTYLGSVESEQGLAVRLDGEGNGYITGWTDSTINFPTTSGAYRRRAVFGREAFVTKIQP